MFLRHTPFLANDLLHHPHKAGGVERAITALDAGRASHSPPSPATQGGWGRGDMTPGFCLPRPKFVQGDLGRRQGRLFGACCTQRGRKPRSCGFRLQGRRASDFVVRRRQVRRTVAVHDDGEGDRDYCTGFGVLRYWIGPVNSPSRSRIMRMGRYLDFPCGPTVTSTLLPTLRIRFWAPSTNGFP